MLRLPAVLVLIAATAAAQDHILPLGFADNVGPAGPLGQSFPVARVKDSDLDGNINILTEQYAFLTTSFNNQTTPAPGFSFMVDAAVVFVNGEYEFYMVDAFRGTSATTPAGHTFQGHIVRGVDRNHNGVLDRGEDVNGNGVLDPGEDANLNGVLDTEVNDFFNLGTTTATNLFTPDAIAVYRDNLSGQTRVYISLDNSTATSTGLTHGIWRLVDGNGDGDAQDAGEATQFVSSTMGLTVPGNAGPVTLNGDFYTSMKVLPGGKLIAYAQGLGIATGGTLQPPMNAFYGFTDNNGTAVPEVWFNCSVLNNLPRHPDWVNGTYPAWDVSYGTGLRNFARWISVAPHGYLGALPAYFIASSYNVVPPPNTVGNPGDLNSTGQHVAGLIYRVVDVNQNQVIDPGELTLWANLSGTTYAGVPPIGFTNQASTVITSLTDRSWGIDATDNGEVSFLYANGGADGIVTMADANGDGIVDASEIRMTYATTTDLPPYSPSFGPFLSYFAAVADGTMPGPFPVGIATSGEGCSTTTRGLKMVMDAWGGAPQIGNGNFKLGPIRGIPGSIGVLALAAGVAGPFPLTLIGGPVGCTVNLDPGTLTLLGYQFTDGLGRTIFNTPIPATPSLIGGVAVLQGAEFDLATPVSLQYHTTNALIITIQP